MQERLFRKRTNRVIGGVAAGLADYVNIDPILMRVIFIIVTLFNGLGILLYIILWIVVPEEPLFADQTSELSSESSDTEQASSSKEQEILNKLENKSSGKGRIFFGIILIAVGIIFLAERFFPYFDFEDIFPVVLIIIGLILVWNSTRK